MRNIFQRLWAFSKGQTDFFMKILYWGYLPAIFYLGNQIHSPFSLSNLLIFNRFLINERTSFVTYAHVKKTKIGEFSRREYFSVIVPHLLYFIFALYSCQYE